MAHRDGTESDPRADIFRAWQRGITPEGLTSIYGMSVEEILTIVREEADKRPLPSALNPLELIRDHLLRLDAVIEELAMAASRTRDATSVRALTGRFEVEKYKFELMRIIGVLPRDFGQLAVEIDAVRLADGLLEILEEHGLLTDEVEAAIIAAFDNSRGFDIPTEPIE